MLVLGLGAGFLVGCGTSDEPKKVVTEQAKQQVESANEVIEVNPSFFLQLMTKNKEDGQTFLEKQLGDDFEIYFEADQDGECLELPEYKGVRVTVWYKEGQFSKLSLSFEKEQYKSEGEALSYLKRLGLIPSNKEKASSGDPTYLKYHLGEMPVAVTFINNGVGDKPIENIQLSKSE